ncbi:unnamed protein product, partial [Rotaria sp. Silwood1]
MGDTSSIIYRPIGRHEHKQVLDLWSSVFKLGQGYFERYFTVDASPCYQEGDTLGAWYDEQLVSTVHIRRIIIRSRDNDGEYLCAAISNVATLEEYRERGFSRQLLRMAVDKMEHSGEFEVSSLDTRQPSNYSTFGWEQISVPATVTIEWENFDPAMINVEWRSASEVLSSDRELLLELHTSHPREYQFDRSPSIMFEHWAGWVWQQDEAIVHICGEVEAGYVVISKPNDINNIYVSEWRAPNLNVERKLLKSAAKEIRRRQHQQTNF